MKIFLNIILFFLVFTLTFSYAATIDFQSTESNLYFSTYYCDPNIQNCPTLGSLLFDDFSIDEARMFEFSTLETGESIRWKGIYVYKSNKRIEIYSKNTGGGGVYSETIYPLQGYFSHSASGPAKNDLREGDSCRVSSSVSSSNIVLNSNLDYLSRYSTGTYVELPSHLNQYYHMNTRVIIKARNIDTGSEIELYNQEKLMPEYDKTKNIPYSIDENSGEIIIDGNSPQTLSPGNYKLIVETDTSIEQKCTNNRDRKLTEDYDFTINSAPAPTIRFSPKNAGTNENVEINLEVDNVAVYTTTCSIDNSLISQQKISEVRYKFDRNGIAGEQVGNIVCSIDGTSISATGTVTFESQVTPMPDYIDNSTLFIDKENRLNIISPPTLTGNILSLNLRTNFNTTHPSYNIDSNWHQKAKVEVTLERKDITGNGINEEFKNHTKFPQLKSKTHEETFKIYHSIDSSIQINLKNLFPEVATGDYKISVKVIPRTHNFKTNTNSQVSGGFDNNLFCNTTQDSDCDSVPNEADVCPDYGSAYFLGCKDEYVSFDGTPVRFEKELTNCKGDGSALVDTNGEMYLDENNNLVCVADTRWDIRIKNLISGEQVRGNSDFARVTNPVESTYKCYVSRLFGNKDDIDTCDIKNTDKILNGLSVFDLDSDSLQHYPKQWQRLFGESKSSEDRCPASYGLVVDEGCPRTNREDIVENEDLISFEDNYENKLEFSSINNSIYYNGELVTTYTPFTKSIPVNISTACIPTVRISKLAKYNPQVRDALNDLLGGDSVNRILRDGSIREQDSLEESKKITENLNKNQLKKLYQFIQENGDCGDSISRNDNLTDFSLLSAMHYLFPVDNSQNTRDLINSVIDTTNALSMNKQIDPYETADSIKTRITLNIENIPANTTIWQIIPKESAPDIETLYSSISLGNADEIRIKDKDPIIGWYFGEGGNSGDLEFEIDGTGEGGVTVPIEDTIYYNFGELIVNYREGGCFGDERELFTVEHFNGGLIDVAGVHPYSLCIAHNGTDDITSSAIETESFFSIQGNQFDNSIQNILLYKESPITKYYAMYYGTYPPRNGYSCIGSVDGAGNFGDCLYNSNQRIWMYYGPDPFPPEVSLSQYVPAHTISFRIQIEDLLSGVDWSTAQYCIAQGTSSCTMQPYTANQLLTVTCPDVNQCLRTIYVEVSDIEGNVAQFNETLILLQEASACNAQCLAAPAPGRYLSSCRNVNGCEYFALANETLPTQKGTYVANLCHYKIEGSWVELGGGLELQCPNGPLRASKFSSENFEVDSTICEQIQSRKAPVLIDGEEVYMHVITCE